ncbi:MAG: glycosyltransferase family 39 protein [bacterium]|nr:glycosyltransferase family 39 protein [bacterium]
MNKLLKNNILPVFLIALIAGLIFIPFIGNCPLFDWDEVNFAECAREMIVSGNYSLVQLNFRPFWEKPPMFIWFQVLSMHVFGINEFAARFPNALCSIATLVTLYLIGQHVHSKKFGLLWAGIYVTSLLPHFYFKTGIIDPWFNLFILLAVFNCFRFLSNPQGKRELLSALLAGLFLGMAVLTKGPAALLILGLTLLAYLVWNKQLKLLFTTPFILFVGSTLLVSGSWFLIEWLKGNGMIIRQFIDYQWRLAETTDAGHGGSFYYHFVVLLIGCFPASLIFILSYFNYREITPYNRNFRRLLLCLFWVVLLIFSVVKTKIVHYSSVAYFPLSFVAALGLVENFKGLAFPRPLKIVYWLVAGLLGLAALLLGLFKFMKDPLLKSGLIKDEFAAQNMAADVHWSGYEWLLGVLFLASAVLIYRALLKNEIKLIYIGLALNLVFIILTVNVIIPKIEMYTQRATIEFYKQCAKHPCYVETHGFKSYAYLFYSQRQPSDYQNPEQQKFIEHKLDEMVRDGSSRVTSYAVSNQLWMEYGIVDRPAYLVTKSQLQSELLRMPGMTKLYELNGFTFFVRMPSDTAK